MKFLAKARGPLSGAHTNLTIEAIPLKDVIVGAAVLSAVFLAPAIAGAGLVVTDGTAFTQLHTFCMKDGMPWVGCPDTVPQEPRESTLVGVPSGHVGDSGWGRVTWSISGTRIIASGFSAQGSNGVLCCGIPCKDTQYTCFGYLWAHCVATFDVTFSIDRTYDYVATISGAVQGISAGAGTLGPGSYTITANPSINTSFSIDVALTESTGACYTSNNTCSTMTSGICLSSGGLFCRNSKALVIRGWHCDNSIDHAEVASALVSLHTRGWLAEYLPNPTRASLAAALQADSCIRGLYIVAHGCQDRPGHPGECGVLGSSAFFLADPQNEQIGDLVFPVDVGNMLGGRHLEFVTPSVCRVWEQAWREAVDVDMVYMPYRRLDHQRTISARTQLEAVRRLGHGVSNRPCISGDKSIMVAEAASHWRARLPIWTSADSMCASFSLCMGNKCGSELYPVYSCASIVAVPVAGVVAAVSTDSMFAVELFYDEAYADSVACVGSYFEAVPEGLLAAGSRGIGRYLLFDAIASDSLVVPDSVRVTMKYEDEDWLSSEAASEDSLSVVWLAQQGTAFEKVGARHDSLENSFSFTVPGGGVAGIYDWSNMPVYVDEIGAESSVLDFEQNHPNPFNPRTVFNYRLSRTGRVSLRLYDVRGAHVRTLLEESEAVGQHRAEWDGRAEDGSASPAGVYFARLQTEEGARTIKIVLLR